MALQSKFKNNSKLRNCAVADKDHIGENTFPVEDRKGEHVALIHEALNTFAGKQSPPVKPVASGEVSAQAFGSDTARVVRLFKTRNKIFNFKGEIDNIVGIKTVAALDLELPAAVDPDPPKPTSNLADVVVRFQGARAAGRWRRTVCCSGGGSSSTSRCQTNHSETRCCCIRSTAAH